MPTTTFKAKCLHANGGLRCSKQHAHCREIVSDVYSHHKRNFRHFSRAIRILKKLSGEYSWTLWNQSELAFVLHSRTNDLIAPTEFSRRCPCGQHKQAHLNYIKVDAAQFFKNANMSRGVARIQQLLALHSKRSNLRHVAVSKYGKAHGYLCKAKHDSQAYRIIAFSDIEAFLQYSLRDRFFLVGDAVIQREVGWAMGAAFSEPATLVDMGYTINDLQQNPRKLQDIGWNLGDHKFNRLICGATHVDDSIIGSFVFCHQCLQHGIEQAWPADFGISVEEVSPCIRFLSSWITVLDDQLHITTHHPNISFCLGFRQDQKVARLGPYVSGTSRFDTLRSFMIGQITTYNYMLRGSQDNCILVVQGLLKEVCLLGWPQNWIHRALAAIPRRHMSTFTRALRKLGYQLRRNDINQIFDNALMIQNVRSNEVFAHIMQYVIENQ